MRTTDTHPQYFAAIDGCRALAVLAVVLYHIGGYVPGGYVGVDLFFVISGFVVTLSARQLPSRSLSQLFLAFYRRRILRIAPALISCVLVCMVVHALIVPQAWLSNSGPVAGIAALFGVSNIYFSSSANGYWEPRSEYNPFTHTWSLGVEEQFYLVFPFLFWISILAGRRVAVLVLASLAVASVGVLWYTQSSGLHHLAFYSLPARFWELAVGATLGLSFSHIRSALAERSALLLSGLSLASLVSLAWLMSMVEQAEFPWPWAVPIVVASAAVVVISAARPDLAASRVLAWPALVAIGRVSYSLYLWHWPVSVYFRWTVGLEAAAHHFAALAISACLAIVSYRYVERPWRTFGTTTEGSESRVVRLGVMAVCAAAGIAAGVAIAKPWISLSVTRDRAIWRPDTTLDVPLGSCTVEQARTSLMDLSVTLMTPVDCKRVSAQTLYVVGDSHADAYRAMITRHSALNGTRIVLVTRAGCSFLSLKAPIAESDKACTEFKNSVVQLLSKHAQAGDTVFLPALRMNRIADQWGAVKKREVTERMREGAVAEAIAVLRPIAASGVNVLLEGPKPVFARPTFRCSDWFNSTNPSCTMPAEVWRSQLSANLREVDEALKSITSFVPTARVWEPFDLLCPSDPCSPWLNGEPMIFDGDHLTGAANKLLSPSFESVMRAIAASAPNS